MDSESTPGEGSYNYNNLIYFILHGQIKQYNNSITAIMCQGDSYRNVAG